MRAATTKQAGSSEATILTRILCNGLSPPIARHFQKLAFNPSDKARMHDLAVRNQDDALSASEKEEILASAKAGTLLSILNSRARRALRRP
jgi:hypothetical protein